ncbi:MAG TPA: hypothetical protein VJB58_01430 [Candidatus Paceibacterota bacterium]
MKLFTLVVIFLWAEVIRAQDSNIKIFSGKIVAKSWRTRTNEGKVTRDIKVTSVPKYLSDGRREVEEIWVRVSQKVADKLKPGQLCLFTREEFWGCNVRGDGFVASPIRLKPFLEKLFIGSSASGVGLVPHPKPKKGSQ